MKWDSGTVANLAVVLAAVLVGATSVRSLTRGDPPSRGLDPAAPPEYVEGWEKLESMGVRSGSPTAPVTIVEFADLECPFCKVYEGTLDAFMKRHPGKVSRVFVHYPLEMHRFARRAAQALECAADAGSFDLALAAIYARQLDFSSNPWAKVALDAGTRDTISFNKCVYEEPERSRIGAGARAAESLKLSGTPSVLINGYLYVGAPPDSVLEQAVELIGDGKKPPRANKSRATRKLTIE